MQCSWVWSASSQSAVLAPTASAVDVRFQTIAGIKLPRHAAAVQPRRHPRRSGRASARNILVLNPGTSASAATSSRWPRPSSSQAPGWQVWAVERRENLLEDQSMLDRAKAGQATAQQVFDYYLGYLDEREHPAPLPAHPGRRRRLRPRLGHEHRDRATCAASSRRRSAAAARSCVGGHSLGGTITTAYATWDFKGKAGRGRPLRPRLHRRRQRARAGVRRPGHAVAAAAAGGLAVADVRRHPGALCGPVQHDRRRSACCSTRTRRRSGQAFPLLPANLKPPVPGHQRRPVRLRAGHRHVAALARRGPGPPRPAGRQRRRRAGWDDDGGITPSEPLRRRCSPARASWASTARPGTTRCG